MKKEKGISTITIICIFLLFAMLMFYGTFYIVNKVPSTDSYFSEYNKTIPNELKKVLKEQEETNNNIDGIISSGRYTFDNPYVIDNPYKLNPLSMIIIFKTDKATSIEVTLNGKRLFQTAKTKEHKIPVYGLVSNYNNVIGIKTEDGLYREIEKQTESYNNTLGEVDMPVILQDKSTLFLLGKIENKNVLRAFNQEKNMIMYLDFGYISGYKINEDTISILYNAEDTTNNKMPSINVELDYLGRIKRVEEASTQMLVTANQVINNINYISATTNIYPKNMSVYSYSAPELDETTSKPIVINTSTISDILISSEAYGESYKLSLNNNMLTYDFNNEEITLLLVQKDSKYTYTYETKDKNMIKIGNKNKYSLYIIKDGKYYNLLATIEI